MATYKLDFLDQLERVTRSSSFIAFDDSEAVAVAEAINNAPGYELSRNNHLVAQVLPSPHSELSSQTT